MFFNCNLPLNDDVIYKNINEKQIKAIKDFVSDIQSGKYGFVKNPCLCGNKDARYDLLLTEKDRYGIPSKNILCKKCGIIRLDKTLDDPSTIDFYSKVYRNIYVGNEKATEFFFQEQAIRGQTFIQNLESATDFDRIENVFEIGCGAGGILWPFKGRGKRVSGCDYGPKYLEFGKSKGLKLFQGDIENSNILPLSQDLIILSHVFEHFNNPIEALINIASYVKEDGLILIEVPSSLNIKRAYINPIYYFQNAHVFNFYPYFLKVLFGSMGMKVAYSNDICVFILQKPKNWVPSDSFQSDEMMGYFAEKIEKNIRLDCFLCKYKIHPYMYRSLVGKLLRTIGLKS